MNQSTIDQKNSTFHLSGLTEIRAIAALVVVISHIDQFSQTLQIPKIHIYETKMAGFAVVTFFVLSGFLITHLLKLEEARFSKISMRFFYIRRILRIWPAYYLVLIVSSVIMVLGITEQKDFSEFLGSILLFIGMVPNVAFVFNLMLTGTAPLWSIGVEEQFYIFWPIVVSRIKKVEYLIFAIVIIYLGIKILLFLGMPTSGYYALFNITSIDCMAIGALVALIDFNNNRLWISIIIHPLTQTLTLLFLISPLLFKVSFFANLETELYAVASAIWVFNASKNPYSIFSLSSKPLRFLGRISYGIYVYHMLVIVLVSKLSLTINPLFIYTLIIGCVILISYVSYKLFEIRFIKLKYKFTRIASKM